MAIVGIGPLLLAGSNHALKLVRFAAGSRSKRVDPDWQEDPSQFREVVAQLKSYFDGRRKMFDLPLLLEGTEFQKKVWAALLTIPFGETRSYAQIAAQIRNPKAVRAVGAYPGRPDRR